MTDEQPTEKDTHADCKASIADLTNTLQRLQAEFENYKKRVERENERIIQQASRSLVRDLLPIIDNFERAFQHDDKEGFRHIYDALQQVLQQEGVGKIDAKGAVFDPKLHEALLVEPTNEQAKDRTVTEVFEEGYVMNGEVLRHAKVKVAKYQEEKTNG